MPMAIKGVRVRSLATLNLDANMDREDRNLAQLQLLEMERQLLIISAMIERVRSRWALQMGQLSEREDTEGIGSGLG